MGSGEVLSAIHPSPMDGFPNGAVLLESGEVLDIVEWVGDDGGFVIVAGPTTEGEWLVFDTTGFEVDTSYTH